MKALLLCLILFLFLPREAAAYFTDSEAASNNQVSTSILDISLTKTSDSSSKLTKVANSADSKYQISYQATGEDNNLCEEVGLLMTLDGVTVYDGKLTSLVNHSDSAFYLTDNSIKNFEYQFTVPPGSSCNFKLKYFAWQYELPDPSFGFTSIKSIDFLVSGGLLTKLDRVELILSPSPTPTPIMETEPELILDVDVEEEEPTPSVLPSDIPHPSDVMSPSATPTFVPEEEPILNQNEEFVPIDSQNND